MSGKSSTVQMSLSGPVGWNSTLATQFGQPRWKRLLRAMAEEPLQLAYLVPPTMIPEIATNHLTATDLSDWVNKAGFTNSGLPNCYSLPENTKRCDSSSLPSLLYFLGTIVVRNLLEE